jgi:hypothetical protein
MAAAVVAAMVLTMLLPDAVRVGPIWLLPAVEGTLLVILLADEPGTIRRHSRQIRAISIALVANPTANPDLAFPQLINPGLACPAGGRGSSTTSTSVSRTRRRSARRT